MAFHRLLRVEQHELHPFKDAHLHVVHKLLVPFEKAAGGDGRNSFSSGTTSVLRAVFASRDEPMASAPALPEASVSGQFVQIFGRKQNPRGGDVLVKVRHR
jgi:hypothetical protein